MDLKEFLNLAEKKAREYLCSLEQAGSLVTEETYQLKPISRNVCVVYGNFMLHIKMFYTLVCKLERNQVVIAHSHLSAESGGLTDQLIELKRSSCMDGMTQIYNRCYMEGLVNRKLTESGKECAFIMIDLDNFKYINDTRGHAAGDRYLVEFARVLKDFFQSRGDVGRIGGDEFCVFMDEVRDSGQVEREWELFLDKLDQKMGQKSQQGLSCSAGMSFSGGKESCFMELYEKADRAMYFAKKQKKGKYHIYQEN